jgi:plasmid maintenance system antidote protein VapI
VPLQAERLRWLLEVIGWSRGELARRLDIAESSAAQMCQGKRNIPNRAAVWLETPAAIHL